MESEKERSWNIRHEFYVPVSEPPRIESKRPMRNAVAGHPRWGGQCCRNTCEISSLSQNKSARAGCLLRQSTIQGVKASCLCRKMIHDERKTPGHTDSED